MKGQLLRKRYFLLGLKENWDDADRIEKDLFRTFHAKSKYHRFPYVIVLTDQFQKDFISAYIGQHYPGTWIVSVSGTMKKLKSLME